MNSGRTLHLAQQVVDGGPVDARPGALLVEGDRVLAAGSPEAVGRPAGVRVIDHGARVLIPALVNAHAHLDLTHIGLRPFDGSFADWVTMIRSERATTEAGIRDSVLRGIDASRAGGVALVGDIAGVRSLIPGEAMVEAGMAGVSFVEIFGIGRSAERAAAFVRELNASMPREKNGVMFGLQPHAPYSCDPAVYRAAAATGRPISTHLAETLDELRYVAHGDGPLADMLRAIGVWDESIRAHGGHPVDAVLDAVGDVPVLAAHLNYLPDDSIERLARSRIAVAYCPRASRYFGHPHDGEAAHRYRDLLEAGVRIALGTDSLVCLDTPDRLSTLDEMRLLARRDGVDPRVLLRMATIDGAEALGVDGARFSFSPGPIAGVLALEAGAADRSPLAEAMRRDDAPSWVIGGPDRHKRPSTSSIVSSES